MRILHYKELISGTLINPFDHPYVIINKEMEILGFHGELNTLVFHKTPHDGDQLQKNLVPALNIPVNLAFEEAIRGKTKPSNFLPLADGYQCRVQVIPAPFEVEDNRYICFFEIIGDSQIADSKANGVNGHLDSQSQADNIFYKSFHAAPIPLAIVQLKDCCLIEINDAFVKKAGYQKKQLVGKSAWKLGLWKNPQDPKHLIQLLERQQYVHHYEVSFTLQNGKEIHTLLNLDLVEINNQKCLLTIIQDITEIKHTEAKLKQKEQLLVSINENLKEGIYRSTPEDGFIYLNEAFAKMFGLSLEEAMGINPEKLYANETDRAHIKELMATEGYLKNEQIEFRKQNGETFWGLLSGITTQDAQGNYIYDGAIVDISDIKKSKLMLHEKNDELKKINAELDRFVYSASHDLRAPLTSLLGLVNIALMETKNEKVVDYLEMMKGSVNKLDSLISDIINFSRNARLGLEPELIDFDKLVREAIDHLKYMACTDSIATEIHIAPQQEFYSDPKRLIILINNLISNAFRYHDLNKANPFIKVNVSFNEGSAIVDVTDNGKGIDPEHVNSIFEMFFRATTDSNGSGLGLYIVKETAEKLQGFITVTSELEKGSTFRLTIPNLKAS